MADGREIRWFGHPMRMDNNRMPRQAWVQELRGRDRKDKDRMGNAYADDEEKREDLAVGG
jgi:hypothetical protein